MQIGGQAGIGKSRLTQGLRERVSETHRALHYQCSPFHLNSPLHPFIEELEESAGFLREDAAEQKLEKLEVALSGLSPHGQDALGLFAALLSLPAGRSAPLQLSPQKQKEKTLEALIDRMRALAERGPMIIVFEDIHWIDPTSQDLLELLVPVVNSIPVLLVMTYRSEFEPPWSGAHVNTITLNRLNREQGALLVGNVTRGKALPGEVLDEVLARTDGIPLFVEELTRSVLESGLLRDEGGHYVLQGPLSALAIPVSLRDSLMARLDRLGKVKELAQIGACIGREFSFELLQPVSSLRADALDQELEKLVDAGLVSRNGLTPHSIYTFKHALVQDAAYESLLRSRRSELHSKIADVLANQFADRVANKPEWLAYHHTQAGHLTQAIPLWQRAGTLAVSRVALKEAVAHFSKGLGLIDQLVPSEDRDSLELTIREPLNAAWTGLRGWAAPEVGENSMAILRLAESRGNQRNPSAWRCGGYGRARLRRAGLRIRRSGRTACWPKGTRQGKTCECFGHLTAMVQYMSEWPPGQISRAGKPGAGAVRSGERGPVDGDDGARFAHLCGGVCVPAGLDHGISRSSPAKLSDECVVRARVEDHAFNLVWALTFSAYVFAYRCEPERFLERLARQTILRGSRAWLSFTKFRCRRRRGSPPCRRVDRGSDCVAAAGDRALDQDRRQCSRAAGQVRIGRWLSRWKAIRGRLSS